MSVASTSQDVFVSRIYLSPKTLPCSKSHLLIFSGFCPILCTIQNQIFLISAPGREGKSREGMYEIKNKCRLQFICRPALCRQPPERHSRGREHLCRCRVMRPCR